MQPPQAPPQYGYQQPFGVPVRLRANPGASVLAGLLALLTAGLLSIVSLFFATMVIITPLLRDQDVSAHFDWVFGFGKATGVAIGLTVIAGVLTAIVAMVAAAAKRP